VAQREQSTLPGGGSPIGLKIIVPGCTTVVILRRPLGNRWTARYEKPDNAQDGICITGDKCVERGKQGRATHRAAVPVQMMP
jgi:hypothetical protein